MTKEKGGQEEQPKAGAALGRGSRIAAMVGSVVLALAGLAALFLTTNQAGTAVVIAAAALFGVIGLGGHLPTKFKFGDNEITMPIIEAVSKKIESASPQEAGELAERVIAALPGGMARMSSSTAYYYLVKSAVFQLISEGAPFSFVEHAIDLGGVDFSLRERTNKSQVDRLFDVLLKFAILALPIDTQVLSTFLTRAKYAVASSMLITNLPLDDEGRRMFEAARAERPDIHIITASTREELVEALRPILLASPQGDQGTQAASPTT